MPLIETGVVQEVVSILSDDPDIQSLVAQDPNNNLSIRPAKYTPSGTKFPQITIGYSEGNSDSLIPASVDTVNMTVWVNELYKEPYKFLDQMKNIIINIFNREGGDYNRIDEDSNSGIRFCQFKKLSATIDFEDEIKCYYCEVIFEVIRSENESFAPVDAGNGTWQ